MQDSCGHIVRWLGYIARWIAHIAWKLQSHSAITEFHLAINCSHRVITLLNRVMNCTHRAMTLLYSAMFCYIARIFSYLHKFFAHAQCLCTVAKWQARSDGCQSVGESSSWAESQTWRFEADKCVGFLVFAKRLAVSWLAFHEWGLGEEVLETIQTLENEQILVSLRQLHVRAKEYHHVMLSSVNTSSVTTSTISSLQRVCTGNPGRSKLTMNREHVELLRSSEFTWELRSGSNIKY